MKTLTYKLVNIEKSYGKTQVLRGLDLTIEEGDFVVVRGKSGVGKSSLLKILGLLEFPDNGEVILFEQDINGLSDDERAKIRLDHIGFIFQFFNLIPSLTILENIELPLALFGVNKKERKTSANELLEYFNLHYLAERFPDTLSGGERQRIAVIRALTNNPKIIVADEPTSCLDDENSELLLKLFYKVNREQKVTIVLATTDLYKRLPSDRDYMLKQGKLHELDFTS